LNFLLDDLFVYLRVAAIGQQRDSTTKHEKQKTKNKKQQ